MNSRDKTRLGFFFFFTTKNIYFTTKKTCVYAIQKKACSNANNDVKLLRI